MRPDFNIIKRDIFRGESGGDYDALFNYMNRSGGMFDDVKITDMTVDGALDFATLSGPGSNYASYVGIQNGGVKATPMGAYQVVGTTLRDAKRGLGLRGDELMTRDLQDRIGRYIYDTQGTGAWAGYKGPAYGPANAKQEAAPMLPAQQQGPRGLLEQFGLQKMQPGAAGETGQKFYNRDSFKDAAGRLAVGLNSLRLRPDPNLAGMMADVRNQRTEKNARNKTVEYLRANGMSQYADMIEAGQLPASQVLGAIMQKSMAGTDTGKTQKLIMDARKEFTSLPGVKKFSDVAFSYSRIAASADEPSGAGDLALIFNFMKMLDPGSSVMEGEFANAENTGSVDQRIFGLYNRLLPSHLGGKGERLTQTQRADFIGRATKLYSGAQSQYQSIADQYGGFAQNAGLDPSQVIPDFSYSGGEIPIPEVTDGSSDIPPMPTGDTVNGQPMTQTQWESIWGRASGEDKEYFRQNGRLP